MQEERSQILWKALERAVPDIRARTQVKLVGSPLTHERYILRHEGTYGAAISASQGSFPGPQTPLPGLYRCLILPPILPLVSYQLHDKQLLDEMACRLAHFHQVKIASTLLLHLSNYAKDEGVCHGIRQESSLQPASSMLFGSVWGPMQKGKGSSCSCEKISGHASCAWRCACYALETEHLNDTALHAGTLFHRPPSAALAYCFCNSC